MGWSKHEKTTGAFGDLKIDKSDYIKPEEFLNKYGAGPHIIKGAFINERAKFGAHPVVFIETSDGLKGLDLNAGYTDQWREILSDPDDIATIKAGKATGTLAKMFSEKYKRDYVAFNI